MLRVFGGVGGGRLCSTHAAVGAATTAAALRRIFVKCKETPNDDCMMFFADRYEFLRPRKDADEANGAGAAAQPMMTITVAKEEKHISPLAKRIFALQGVAEVTIGQKFVTVTRQTEPDLGEEESEEDIRQRISLTNTAAIKEGKGYADNVPPAQQRQQQHPPQPEAPSSTVSRSTPGTGPQVKQHVLPAEEVKPWEPPHWFDLQFQVCAAICDHAHSKEPAVELDAPHPHIDTLPQEGDTEVVLSIKELIATVIRPEIQQDGGDIRFLDFLPDCGEMHVELLGACKSCKSSTTTLADLIERTTRHWIPEVTSVVEVHHRRKQLEQARRRALEEGSEEEQGAEAQKAAS